MSQTVTLQKREMDKLKLIEEWTVLELMDELVELGIDIASYKEADERKDARHDVTIVKKELISRMEEN